MTDRDPALIWRPLPEASAQPTIKPYQWIVHTAVDGPGPTNLGNYFERSDITLESHTWLRWDRHEQLMEFDRRADANYKANRFLAGGVYCGAISTETEDDGTPEQRPWNDYQIKELIRFGTWLSRTYGIPPRIPTEPFAPGMGYHSLFPMVWTNVAGKTCPGGTRIKQFRTIVLPGIQAALTEKPPVQEEDEMKAHLGMAVWANTGDPARPDGAPVDGKVYLIGPKYEWKRHIPNGDVLAGLVWINNGGIFGEPGILLQDMTEHPIWNPPGRNIWGYGVSFLDEIPTQGTSSSSVDVDSLVGQLAPAIIAQLPASTPVTPQLIAQAIVQLANS